MLEELKRLLEASTPAPWHALLKMHPSVKPHERITGVHSVECQIYHAKLDPVCIKETHDRQKADAALIAALRNSADKLIAVCEAADRCLKSINKVYSGSPGKLEWPEYHYLKQSLEALNPRDVETPHES